MSETSTIQIVKDKLINFMTGLGTAIDKTSHSEFVFMPQNQGQLDAAYRGSWLARKIVDIPADDATREWREWEDPRIAELEEDLELKPKVHEAIIKSRLYGGACLYLGLPGDPREPIENVGSGELQFLRVFTRWKLSEEARVTDITSPYFGLPEFFTLTDANNVTVHASRLVCFVPKMIPTETTTNVWGDSVLDALNVDIKHAAEVSQHIASLVHEAKVDIVKVPNLLKNVSRAEYRDDLITRFQLADRGKGLFHTMLLDKLDEHSRISVNFAGLPDILKTYLLLVSGAADIPVTRMLGQSPSGLSATGESDLRNYYDSVSSDQSNVLTPTLKPLDEALVASVTGSKPKTLDYEWRPLWQLTATEAAQRNLIEAQTFQVDASLGLYNDEVLMHSRTAQLIASGLYPGFEEIEKEYGGPPEDDLPEQDPDVKKQFEGEGEGDDPEKDPKPPEGE